MKISSQNRIVDSSVLIGFPLDKDHAYSHLYEGKQLFYCDVSNEEILRYFSQLAQSGKIDESQVVLRTAARLKDAVALKLTERTYAIANHLLRCYETVWGLENRWAQDSDDLLIAGCAIENEMPLIGHDRIFQRIEILAPEGFRFYTLLDDLPEHAVRRARSRLHLIDSIPVP